MSKTLKARLKIAAITVVTTVSISGALVALPQIARGATLAELMTQLAALQAQITALQGGGSTGTGTGLNLTVDLVPGSRGADVTALQTALKTDSSLYPEGLVTGYYGVLTTGAVQRFQAKYGIVSSGTVATTGYGRVGPKTRAQLNSTFGGAVVVTPPPGTPLPPTPAGSGLTVSSATQPAETLAPQSAARLPFTKVTLTASNDGDVTVKSLTVKREGLADDAIFSGVILLDENGNQIGLEKTFNANHQMTLNQAFVVKAGTSKTLTIAGNMAAALTNYAGQVAKLTVVAVDAGSTAVSGSLPISGNGMTVNASLTLGTLTNPTRGATDPGAANTKEVGTTNFTFSAVRFSAGSTEDLLVKSIRFEQAGSAGAADVANVKIVAGGTEYTTDNDGKYWWANLGDGITVTKGGNLELSIKGDVAGGSNRTIRFDLTKQTDVVALGKLYGYYVKAADGTNTTATAGGFTSGGVEPYYQGFLVTAGNGTLRVEKSNAVAAGNVPIDVSNAELGAFIFEAKGEPVQISAMKLVYTGSGTGTSTDVTSVTIVDANGSVVAGPRDYAATIGYISFTDTWDVPTGVNVYKVKGKLDTSFVSNDTLALRIDPAGMTAKGTVTGKTITPTPTSVTANTQTVKSAALKVSVSPSPVLQNVVRGLNGFLFSTLQYDGSASGEDLRITSQAITLTTSATADADDLNNCVFYDGTTALNTGSNVYNPSGTTVGDDPTATVTFDNQLIVAKGTTKTVDVKCNISASFVSGATIAVGIASGQDTAVTGMTTGTSVTETLTASLGQVMTIKSGGSFTVALDNSSPSTDRWAIANTTDNVMTAFKLHATDEALKLDKIFLSFSSSTASTTDFTKVTLWDGATKIGEAVFAGTETNATSTLTGSFIIPKDGDKILTVKADLANVGTSQPGTAGRRLSINYDGTGTTSTKVIGQSSGSSFNSGTTVDVNGKAINLVKSFPTLAKLDVPTHTLANGSMILYRFSVTAPSAGDVGLFKFTFNVGSTTVSATTSSFSVYGYSDAGFSQAAYGNNPLNANDVKKVGSTTQLQSQQAITSGTVGFASSTQIQVYFDPQTKTASAPNAEAIQVPAGTTRYFELRGTLATVGTGDTLNVSLAGDNQYFGRGISTRFLETASTTNAQSSAGFFIWSPNTTTTAATTTVDWTNGYLLPGLPSTNMEQQTFSK